MAIEKFSQEAAQHGCEEQVEELRQAISKQLPGSAHIAVVAGSGLGSFVQSVEVEQSVSYSQLPHVGASTVAGHSGSLSLCKAQGVEFFMLSGRRHLYEGLECSQTVLLVRALLLEKKIRVLVLSNAAGGLNRRFEVADLMVISDHINWMFRNPLIGPNREDWGARFPDLSDVYSRRLRLLAHEAAGDAQVTLREGVYLALAGPNYETRSEALAFTTLFGADAVGMSTVPEALVAAHMGVETLGISFISNLLFQSASVTHEEVIENAKKVEAKFARLLLTLLPKL